MAVVRPKHHKQHPCCGIKTTKRLVALLLLIVGVGFITYLSLMLRFMSSNNDADTRHNSPRLTPQQQQQAQKGQPQEQRPKDPVVIGHAVSLIKCGRVAHTTGFLDAAAVLRHSIHQQSVHNNNKSKYSYQMIAIIHDDCQHHAAVLQSLGYKPLVVPSPVLLDEIKGEWYRTHVEGENCCGSREFIKLHAYNLTQYPIVVHWDMDVAVLEPMDDLFDAMLYDKDSSIGKRARANLELQHPRVPLPDVIDAFLTKDVTSAQPWEKVQGVQGGFVVARPNPKHLDEYLDFIREGNYVRGRGRGSGWGGGMGYGGFQGAMAYQGVVAYFYDVLHPNTAVELNVCRWNQVVADVLWRGPARKQQYHLHCRQPDPTIPNGNKTDCEDCRVTPVELTKTVHYTACKKPWECLIPRPRHARDQSQQYRLNHLTNITTCLSLFQKWFELRVDFEQRLQKATGLVPSERTGNFEKDSFLGYCKSTGNYIPMNPPPTGYDVNEMYGM